MWWKYLLLNFFYSSGLFGSNNISPGSRSGVSDSSPQSCSSRGGHMGGNSSASNSPPHLIQMVKMPNCYETNGEW